MIKNTLYFMGIVICLSIMAFLFLRTADTNREDMITKYGRTPKTDLCYGDGTCIHVHQRGNTQNPALIFVHGSTASMHLWDKLVPHLEKDYHIILVDLPAHGLSQPQILDDYSPSALVEAIHAVANNFDLDKFTYVGSSMGARLGWHYALAHQDRLSALIMMNPSGAEYINAPSLGPKPKIGLGVRVMQMPMMRPLVSNITPRILFKKQLQSMIYDDALVTGEMVDRYWELFRQKGNRRAAAIRATTDQMPEKIQQLHKINVPTLIVWGEHDEVLPVQQSAYFKQTIKNSQLIIYKNAAHLPMEEIPAQVATDIDIFMSSISP